MQVRKICGLGYFDRLIIDGYMMPMYNNRGIEIRDNESIVDALESNKQSYNQGIGKLRINIVGEAINTESSDDIERMRNHRENELKLVRSKIGSSDRYNIGYADILILKSDYSFPKEVTNKGKTLDDINKLAKGEDELALFTKALEIQKDVINKSEYSDIAIVNRVYINKEFRQCGISTWLHNNLQEIIKVYGMINIAAILLIPGDFSEEAETEFSMTKQKYESMLIKHYKSCGYRFINKVIMCKHITNIKNSK